MVASGPEDVQRDRIDLKWQVDPRKSERLGMMAHQAHRQCGHQVRVAKDRRDGGKVWYTQPHIICEPAFLNQPLDKHVATVRGDDGNMA